MVVVRANVLPHDGGQETNLEPDRAGVSEAKGRGIGLLGAPRQLRPRMLLEARVAGNRIDTPRGQIDRRQRRQPVIGPLRRDDQQFLFGESLLGQLLRHGLLFDVIGRLGCARGLRRFGRRRRGMTGDDEDEQRHQTPSSGSDESHAGADSPRRQRLQRNPRTPRSVSTSVHPGTRREHALGAREHHSFPRP